MEGFNTPFRYQWLLMRLKRYKANAEHIPVKLLIVADTLSHRHLSKKYSSKTEDVNSIVETRPTSNRKHQEIQNATLADRMLQEITHLTLNG